MANPKHSAFQCQYTILLVPGWAINGRYSGRYNVNPQQGRSMPVVGRLERHRQRARTPTYQHASPPFGKQPTLICASL